MPALNASKLTLLHWSLKIETRRETRASPVQIACGLQDVALPSFALDRLVQACVSHSIMQSSNLRFQAACLELSCIAGQEDTPHGGG